MKKPNSKKSKSITDFRAEMSARMNEWLERRPEVRAEKRSTLSGIERPPLYGPADAPLEEAAFNKKIGFPGEYPFTRGVQSTMYRGRTWTMRQYSGFGDAEQTNGRYRYLLAQGTTGLSVAFDLPTQMGRDSDHPMAVGEVGRVGVAIDCADDMEALFSGIPLETVSTSMTINATAHILLALYLAIAKRRGTDLKLLRGTVQNDVLKEYISRGTYIYPPTAGLKIVTDIIEFCKDEVPQWNTLSISGYHVREAGSTAVQEVAIALGNGITYVQSAIDRGLNVDSFAPRLAFFFNCHNDFLEEIAKFRAARRLWANIMRERFKAQSDKSCMLRFHTQTAGSSLTAQQPQVNVVRTSLQALAAVFGGTQSLHTNAFDEALCLPTEQSALLALRTQQVIAFESGVADVVDPFAGSYCVERMTDEIESGALALIAEIDALHGMPRAIEQGVPQRWIEESAFEYQRGIERGEIKVVGVNVCREAAEKESVPLMKIDPEVERRKRERLQAFRAKRDQGAVEASLAALRSAAEEGRNIMPSVCQAAEGDVTLGEISDVLRGIYGEYRQG